MDSTEPTYNQDIKKKVSSYIKKIGYIPVAVRMGHHAQEGKTEDKCKFETMDGPKSLHLPLQDVNKIGGTGTDPDVNKPGIAIVYAPVTLTTGCKYVEMCQEALPEAVARNNVRNLSFKELRRGYVADDLNKSPPR
ncbi:hypothetical protein pipiens_005375 [Culex pipiens pipiens]|uniref:Uncharacterized protein n=1 Tax=Culex pipiens pipiens TaxID=38569 RepID=A0ABD1DXJ1_CULPP